MAQPNVTIADATVRGLLGLVMFIFAMDIYILLGPGAGLWLAIGLASFAALLVATALTQVCPIYLIAGKAPVGPTE